MHPHRDPKVAVCPTSDFSKLGPMEDQNFCSEWVTLLYPNVLYNVLYECLFIINNFIIIIIIIISSKIWK